DVDLVAPLGGRGVHRALAEVARVVNPAVRSGVELDDVKGRRAVPDADAGITFAAGLARDARGRRPLAVQGHGEYPRRGGLAYAPRPREEIPVGHALARHGAAQGGTDVLLDDEIGELLRTVFAG